MFEVSSNNLLAFKTAPNFEAPTDTDTNNIYKVTLTASTAVTSTSIDIEVTVENQQEEANQYSWRHVLARPRVNDEHGWSKRWLASINHHGSHFQGLLYAKPS